MMLFKLLLIWHLYTLTLHVGVEAIDCYLNTADYIPFAKKQFFKNFWNLSCSFIIFGLVNGSIYKKRSMAIEVKFAPNLANSFQVGEGWNFWNGMARVNLLQKVYWWYPANLERSPGIFVEFYGCFK